MADAVQLLSAQFYKPKLLRRTTPPGTRSHRAIFLCSCGREFESIICHVASGKTRSCGCYRDAVGRLRSTHGHTRGSKSTPTYTSYQRMIARCTSPSYHAYERYGGRGISVCQRWLDSFEAFLDDMGERPEGTTLDRRENDKGYSKDNCRWADARTQAENTSARKAVLWNGRRISVRRLVEETGCQLRVETVKRRLQRGAMPIEAVSRPLGSPPWSS